jgi:phosphoglycerate kinase
VTKYSVRDLDLKGRRVFVRVDFNVPVDYRGRITSDNRIRAALPTISLILSQGGIPVVASHFGRPKGQPSPQYSLKPVAGRLAELLNRPVKFTPDCVGPETERMVKAAAPGDVILLENLRFHAAEEENDPEFARALAGLAKLYVNDAFGAAHRAHASTEAIARHFAAPAAGLLMEQEIQYLSRVLEAPERPSVAVIGGAKVKDKLGVIRNLAVRVDQLLLGGRLVFNFFKAQGLEIGRTEFEPEMLDKARALLDEPKVKLPVDVRVGDRVDERTEARNVPANAIPPYAYGLDIGEAAAAEYARLVAQARTIVWAGPLGRFELDQFATGTQAVAQAAAEATSRGAISVVGGGDTGAALGKFGLKKQVSHISTGGSACLEFLEGVILPGIAVLKDK